MMYKRPESVLVVIHTADLQILLLERADAPGFWQSVTGSLEEGENLPEAAWREVAEETGLTAGRMHDWQQQNVWEIYPRWRHRYAPGVTHNTEHVFSLELPHPQPVRLAPDEHLAYLWLPWREAAAQCFSWSNRDAITLLAEKLGH